MRTAIISVTEKGRALSEKIFGLLSDKHDVFRYCFYKYSDENAVSFDNIENITKETFKKYDALIFICACGIAVRAIAPEIISKTSDPAVVVIDRNGRFVIPILSGHIGGANRLAQVISEKIGACAVITTATDIGGKFSPDSFAMANGLIISDMEMSKKIAAAVLGNERIGLVSRYECKNIPAELTVENAESCRFGIVISDKNEMLFPETLLLVPRNIIIGIGCKKGTSAETIAAAVEKVFSENNIDMRRIFSAASIDIKSGENGLLEFCRSRKIPIDFYSAEQLMSVSGDFLHSDFVMKTTGADNVCERSALFGGGRLIIKKTALNGVTVAAAERAPDIDFKKEMF